MSNWRVTDGAQLRTLGILELRLADDREVGPYLLFQLNVSLRVPVQIGALNSATPLVILSIRAKSDFLARMEAERAAEKWLDANLDALCESEL